MNPIDAIAFKQGKVVTITYPAPGTTGTVRSYDPATDTWTALPMNPGGLPVDRPGSLPGIGTRFVSAMKALYYQSKYGLAKIEDISSGVSRNATIPAPLVSNGDYKADATNAFSQAQAGGWLGKAADTSVTPAKPATAGRTAYRITVARFGANHELIESEPSDRIVVDGPVGEGIASIFVNDSWMVPEDAFYRIYRSVPQVASTSDPGDEMFLVREVVPTGDLRADGYHIPLGGEILYPDITPDLTGTVVPLYTNEATGGGAAAANTSAPVSTDMVYFRNRLHFFNTRDYGRLVIQIIGTGGATGIQPGDSLTINGTKFTYATTPDLAVDPNAIQLYTTGSFTANLEKTAWATVNSINRYYANVTGSGYTGPLSAAVEARYISTTSGPDIGRILIQGLVPGGNPIFVQTSSGNGFDRDYSGGTTADQNVQAAGWRWSALFQPEGVPLSNNNVIGDPSAAVLRAIAIKESLFVFKEDGLWRISDDNTSLGPQLQLVDPTVHLIAPETAIAIDNFVLALCDQGVVLVSETGAPLNVSHQQIERDLFKLIAYVGLSTIRNVSFGVAYPSEHTYILALPESPYSKSCTRQFIYNLQTQAWTCWYIDDVLCGGVTPDTNQLVWGKSDGSLWFERKAFDSTDYQDPGFSITCPTDSATATLTFPGNLRIGYGPQTLAIGDVIQQAQATKFLTGRITAVSYSSATDTTTVTLNAAPVTAWSSSQPLTIVKAIQTTAKFLPIYAGQPLTAKDWSDSFLAFRYCDLDFMTVSWSSDHTTYSAAQSNLEPISSTIQTANGTPGPIAAGAFGTQPWGQEPWGRITRNVIIKATLPQEFASSSQLTPTLRVGNALSSFELSAWNFGISSTQKVDR